jgi:hypothetical protein
MNDSEEVWTVGKVADFLGVHRVTVHRISRTQLPYTEHGGRKIRHYDPNIVKVYGAGCVHPIDESLAGILASHETRISNLETHLRGKDHEGRPHSTG